MDNDFKEVLGRAVSINNAKYETVDGKIVSCTFGRDGNEDVYDAIVNNGPKPAFSLRALGLRVKNPVNDNSLNIKIKPVYQIMAFETTQEKSGGE